MDKVFIVPALIGGNENKDPVGPYFRGTGPSRTNCAAQALGNFLSGTSNFYVANISKLLMEYKKISYIQASNIVWELVKGNDEATTNEARRQNLINWLREHFPECEV